MPRNLIPAHLQALKSVIAADPALADLPVTPDDNEAISRSLNATASPAFYVWRTAIAPAEYRGANGIVWTEVEPLTAGKARIFEWVTGGLAATINAADPNVRAGLAAAFAGTTTLANLTAMARRPATRLEKLFAAGTGSTASPATMAFEGTIDYIDVTQARSM